MSEALGYYCHMCGFTGPIHEFQTNNDDFAPDLADTGVCPDCGEFFEDMADAEFE